MTDIDVIQIIENYSQNYRKIAKFEKVSFERFKQDFEKEYGEIDNIREIYDSIKLPKRATTGSAGYDFFIPFDDCWLKSTGTLKIPTGIRCNINDGWVLQIYPRSGLGFKYRIQLDNTVGIIDSDYYGSDNEGHIFIKISCDSYNPDTVITLNQGDAFAQGVFVPYGICIDDTTDGIRNGGFGSTSK